MASPPSQPLVGREVELEWIERRLRRGARLVTVTGLGGIGKTRLAWAIAHARRPAVTWVELASARDHADVLGATARALGLETTLGIDALGSAMAARGRHLLVLDNAERLLDVVVALLEVWLASAPTLKVVVTSREALAREGEEVLRLGPLEPPAAREVFARHAAPSAQGADPADVDEICTRLGAHPLAIEMAARRTLVLPVAELRARIVDLVPHLEKVDRGAAPHHRSLDALWGWSWSSLSEPERSVLGRVSVCRGGFDLALAEQVVGATGKPVDGVLMALVDRCLLELDLLDHGPRFRIHPLVQEYAERDARASNEWEDAAERHALAFRARIEGADLGAYTAIGSGSGHAARFLPDVDNLWAVVERATAAAPLPALHAGLVLARLLGAPAIRSGLFETLESFATRAGDPWPGRVILARATRGLSDHDPDRRREALALLARARDLAQGCGDVATELNAAALRVRLASAGAREVATNEIAPLLERSLEHIGPRIRTGILSSLASSLEQLGRAREAEPLGERALALALQDPDRCGVAGAHHALARIRRALGDLRGARRHLEAGAKEAERRADRQQRCIIELLLCDLALTEGHLDAARRHSDAALRAADFHPWASTHAALLRAGVLAEGGRYGASRDALRLAAARADGSLGLEVGLLEATVAELQGDPAAAEAALVRVEDAIPGGAVGGWVALRRASLALRDGRPEEAARQLARADEITGGTWFLLSRAATDAALSGAPLPTPDHVEADLSAARPWLQPTLGRLALRALSTGRPSGLRWESAARRLSTPEGVTLDLARRPVACRLVEALVRAKVEGPSERLDAAALIGAGWPGERMAPRAATNRLYVALSTLRKLGLDPHLESGDGWSLRTAVTVVDNDTPPSRST